MYDNLAQLDPNYVLAFTATNDNVRLLLGDLSARGLTAVTRPGHDANTLYAFLRLKPDQENDLINIKRSLPFIESVCPLYDEKTTKRIKAFTKKSLKSNPLQLPSDHDLMQLKHLTGDSALCLYLATVKCYTRALYPLAIFGTFVRYFVSGTEFSSLYSVVLAIWTISYSALWVHKLEPQFVKDFGPTNTISQTLLEGTMNIDSSSRVFWKKCLFLPIELSFAVMLLAFQILCFGIEIFFRQIYVGPFASILPFLPTIMLTVFSTILTKIYNTAFVDKFIAWENGAHPQSSKMQKNYIFSFLSSYVPLFLTMFVYLPLGHKVTPMFRSTFLKWTSMLYIPTSIEEFKVNQFRFKQQFFFFIITNQIISFATENIVPQIIEKIVPQIVSKLKKTEAVSSIDNTQVIKKDFPSELRFWKKIVSHHVGPWGEFNADENYRKLMTQFGYIAMFSPIWPLAPLFCIIFNHVMIKADIWRALKKCKPTTLPNATEFSIYQNNKSSQVSVSESWYGIMEALTLLGSVINPTITTMYKYSRLPAISSMKSLTQENWYQNSPINYHWSSLLLRAVLFEHCGFALYFVMSSIFSEAEQNRIYGIVPPSKPNIPKTPVDLSAEANQISGMMKEMQNGKQGPEHGRLDEKSPKVPKIIHERKISITKIPKDHKPQSEKPIQSTYQEKKYNAAPMPNISLVNSFNQNTQSTKPESALDSDVSNSKNPTNKLGSGNSFSSIDAGATLPSVIPTSKNYHLRTSKGGSQNEVVAGNTGIAGIVYDEIPTTSHDEFGGPFPALPAQKKDHEEQKILVDEGRVPKEVTVNKPSTNHNVKLAASAAAAALTTDKDLSNLHKTSSQARVGHIGPNRAQQSEASHQFIRDQGITNVPATNGVGGFLERRRSRHASETDQMTTKSSRRHSSNTEQLSRKSTNSEKSTGNHKHKKGLLHKIKQKL